MQNIIRIKQVKSVIRRCGKQTLWLKSLGLGRIGTVVEVVDTPSVRGLIARLSHCIEIC